MLKRGRREVGSPGFSSSLWRWRGGGVGCCFRCRCCCSRVPLLVVSDEPEVVDGAGGGALISVVDIGAVLVMVAVVVVRRRRFRRGRRKRRVDEVDRAAGRSSCPVTYTTAATRTPMTAMPAALAPITARVELCQGAEGASPPNSSTNSTSSNSSSRSAPVTAIDIRPPTCGNAGSAERRNHPGGEQFQVVEIGHVEKLQVDPLHADLGERAELVDDLVRACPPGVNCREARPPRVLSPPPAWPPRRRRVRRTPRTPPNTSASPSLARHRRARGADTLVAGLGALQRHERGVELGAELRGQRGRPLCAAHRR